MPQVGWFPSGHYDRSWPAGGAVPLRCSLYGERPAAITWAQSVIRDAELRQILHELNAVAPRAAPICRRARKRDEGRTKKCSHVWGWRDRRGGFSNLSKNG